VIRIWPRSLSSQIVLILFLCVLLSLISSAVVHLYGRNQAISTFGGTQTAQRFATIVQLLDPLWVLKLALSNPNQTLPTAT
jgi:hypothetical protein